MKLQTILLCTIALLSLFSCGEDQIALDSELPTIEVIEPAFEATVQKDTVMRITTYFRDDLALKSCTMRIGDENGDVIPDFEYAYTEFYEEDDNNRVRQYTYGDNVSIPANISVSSFYLHFTAVDQNDNTAVLKYKIFL